MPNHKTIRVGTITHLKLLTFFLFKISNSQSYSTRENYNFGGIGGGPTIGSSDKHDD